MKRQRFNTKTPPRVPLKRQTAVAKKSAQKSVISRAPGGPKWGFPPRLSIKHKYVELFNITSTTGSVAAYAFRANGMFDPNASGTGHQPQFFDNCAAIYNHYTVLKSYIKLSVTTTDVTTRPSRIALSLDDDVSGPTTIDAVSETGTGSTVLIPPGSGVATRTLYCSYNANTSFGGSALSNDNLQGTSTADPTEQQFFWVTAKVEELGTQKYAIVAEIVYYVVWDEIKTQSEN